MQKKYNPVKVLKIRKGASLREIYPEAKKQFTAEDLAQYCHDEPMVPATQVLAELKAIYEKEMRLYEASNKKKKK